jgi:hypothetical protein
MNTNNSLHKFIKILVVFTFVSVFIFAGVIYHSVGQLVRVSCNGNTRYNCNDKVKLMNNNEAVIIGIYMDDEKSYHYQIQYFDNEGEISTTIVSEHVITSRK